MSQTACANPLLLEWVKEWWDTARERNSKGVTTYKHAYDSLKACPIPFEHPSSLQQLKGFGPKLCERLTEKLRQHCEENGLPMPPHPATKKRAGTSSNPGGEGADDGPARPAKKAKKAKPYVPAYRSGAYALLLALSSAGEDGAGMTKAELIEEAQPHCDSSFSAPADPTKFYTAWSSMKTLLQKELVYERGRPLKRYALTDEGWEVARRIRETAVPKASSTSDANPNIAAAAPNRQQPALPTTSLQPTVAAAVVLDDEDDDVLPRHQPSNPEFEDVVAEGHIISDDAELPSFTPIRLAPGSFTVELLLDVREVRAKTDRDYMQEELAKRGVKPTVRALDLGDALWVARCNEPGWLARHGAEGDEVVLDWIVERKRLDDLVGSLRDGRFHEQKFRLRRSGVKNVIYLLEEISMDATHFQKYEEAVQSAMASMQVVDGYFLKQTQKMDDTIRYLASMTRMLKKRYEGKTLNVIPTKVLTAKNYLPLLKHLREKQPSVSHHISYPAFASLVSKSNNMALRDLFLKMLMCSKGVTGEKAIEIQRVWKTPNEFVMAYEQCGSGEEGKRRRADLVSSRLGHLVGRKKISKAVSQKLAEVWGQV
ncbi:ac250775-4fbb-4bf1-8514-3273f935af78 [Thermothielavioides terrestris]|uniref:Crossover junction endonuclease MUS81 n=1 Tax=Thermothielavioides terrestris TaxID=2587410 RepID=A0A446B801_9PEZI|nr:ac250775-4fbb-4bf1-8514-3273f935af78 [Thermothielavioides terrestris]